MFQPNRSCKSVGITEGSEKGSKEQSELLKKFAQLRNEGADKVQIHTNKDQGFFSKVRNAFR